MFNKFDLAVKNHVPDSQGANIAPNSFPSADWNNMTVVIEIPRDGLRHGVNRHGEPWENRMKNHYGSMNNIEGMDGENLDVFVGEYPECTSNVFVIDQVDPETKEFDEHKCVIYARHIDDAKKIYNQNYPYNWKGLGSIREMDLEEFKNWKYNMASRQNREQLFNDIQNTTYISLSDTVKPISEKLYKNYKTRIASLKEESDGILNNAEASSSDFGILRKYLASMDEAFRKLGDMVGDKAFTEIIEGKIKNYRLAEGLKTKDRIKVAQKSYKQIVTTIIDTMKAKIKTYDDNLALEEKDSRKQIDNIAKAKNSIKGIELPQYIIQSIDAFSEGKSDIKYPKLLKLILDIKYSIDLHNKLNKQLIPLVAKEDADEAIRSDINSIKEIIDGIDDANAPIDNARYTKMLREIAKLGSRIKADELKKKEGKKPAAVNAAKYKNATWEDKLRAVSTESGRRSLRNIGIFDTPRTLFEGLRSSVAELKLLPDAQFEKMLGMVSASKDINVGNIFAHIDAYNKANNLIKEIKEDAVRIAVSPVILANPFNATTYIENLTKVANDPERLKKVAGANLSLANIQANLRESKQIVPKTVAQQRSITGKISGLKSSEQGLQSDAKGTTQFNALKKRIDDIMNRLGVIDQRQKELKKESRNLSSTQYQEKYIPEVTRIQREETRLKAELARLKKDIISEGKSISKTESEYRTPEEIAKAEQLDTAKKIEQAKVEKWRERQSLASKKDNINKNKEMLLRQLSSISKIYAYKPEHITELTALANEGNIPGFLAYRKELEQGISTEGYKSAPEDIVQRKGTSGNIVISETKKSQLLKAVEDVANRFDYPLDAFDKLRQAALDEDIDKYFALRKLYEEGIGEDGTRTDIVANKRDTPIGNETNFAIQTKLMNKFNVIQDTGDLSKQVLQVMQSAAQAGDEKLFASLEEQYMPKTDDFSPYTPEGVEVRRVSDKNIDEIKNDLIQELESFRNKYAIDEESLKSLNYLVATAQEDKFRELMNFYKNKSGEQGQYEAIAQDKNDIDFRKRAVQIAKEVKKYQELVDSWVSKYGVANSYEEINVPDDIDVPSEDEFNEYIENKKELMKWNQLYQDLQSQEQMQPSGALA